MELDDLMSGYRREMMSRKPRYDAGDYDDVFLDDRAIWLGHSGLFDMWAQPFADTHEGTSYEFVALGKQLAFVELPFDLPMALRYWRHKIASQASFFERKHSLLMIECYGRLRMVQDGICERPNLEQVFGLERAEALMAELAKVAAEFRGARKAGLN